MHVPIMGFRKFSLIYLLANGSFIFNYREGQVMVDSIFLDDFSALIDAGLVG